MKRSHRRVHAIAWIVLVPLMLGVIFAADRERLAPAPVEQVVPAPSGVGVFP